MIFKELKVFEETIKKWKKDIFREGILIQIGNARYHWSIEALEFYLKK